MQYEYDGPKSSFLVSTVVQWLEDLGLLAPMFNDQNILFNPFSSVCHYKMRYLVYSFLRGETCKSKVSRIIIERIDSLPFRAKCFLSFGAKRHSVIRSEALLVIRSEAPLCHSERSATLSFRAKRRNLFLLSFRAEPQAKSSYQLTLLRPRCTLSFHVQISPLALLGRKTIAGVPLRQSGICKCARWCSPGDTGHA